MREKLKAKVANVPAPSPMSKMEPKYGLGFKEMVAWACAKAENKDKPMCHLRVQGQPAPTSTSEALKLSEFGKTFGEFCKVPEHQSKLLCQQSALSKPKKTEGSAIANKPAAKSKTKAKSPKKPAAPAA